MNTWALFGTSFYGSMLLLKDLLQAFGVLKY
jgi:hypothetical protein